MVPMDHLHKQTEIRVLSAPSPKNTSAANLFPSVMHRTITGDNLTLFGQVSSLTTSFSVPISQA